MAQHIKIGAWGEDIACAHLERTGYVVIDRNVRKKWGEIDIICTPATVPCGTVAATQSENKADTRVPRGTLHTLRALWRWVVATFGVPKKREKVHKHTDKPQKKMVFVEVKTISSASFRPEENMTIEKQQKLIRSCRLYLAHKRYHPDTEWQIDVVAIVLDKESGRAKVRHLEQAVYYK